MALSKVNFNSMNVTPAASKAIKFNSSNNGLETGDIGGSLVLIDTVTVTNAGNITFDGSLATGLTSAYKEYIFKLIDILSKSFLTTYLVICLDLISKFPGKIDAICPS